MHTKYDPAHLRSVNGTPLNTLYGLTIEEYKAIEELAEKASIPVLLILQVIYGCDLLNKSLSLNLQPQVRTSPEWIRLNKK